MRKLICVFACLLFVLTTYAQSYRSLGADGQIAVTLEPNVDQLVQKEHRENLLKPTAKVYRIQLVSNTDRQQVYETKSKFMMKFRELKADVDYQQPYYKLRTGFYMDRYEAQRVLRLVKEDFISSYIVKEEVKIDQLLTEFQQQQLNQGMFKH